MVILNINQVGEGVQIYFRFEYKWKRSYYLYFIIYLLKNEQYLS